MQGCALNADSMGWHGVCGGKQSHALNLGLGGCRDVPCSRVGLSSLQPCEGWQCHGGLLGDCFASFF